MNRKAIAIVPARGGSKRLPRKNILNFGGKPMINWTIEAALGSKLFDRIIVSTDESEIALIARDAGAEVPFLRQGFSDDFTPVSQATLAALIQSEKFFEEQYDIVVQLMANCPMRRSVDIENAHASFDQEFPRSLISCFKFGWMNPWWAASLSSDGTPLALFPANLEKRSQDLPPLFCPSGAIWISSTKILKKTGTFYSKNHRFFEIDWKSAVDIDDQADMELALAIFKLQEGRS